MMGHYATLGNDGDLSTRWCAADGKANHYWQVDLGASHSLTSVSLQWEKASAYKFKVESSNDAAAWSVILDETQSSTATAAQTYDLPANTVGRHVRITVTGGLSMLIWASFFELQVIGH